MNEINLIVAAGRDGAIGREGNLIWKIPADLRRFKTLTMGHPVIMGRNTWESLPRRPLPGRRNIVVTRNGAYKADGAEIAHSPEEALRLTEGESPFVMGGEQIYRSLLPYVTRIYLTEIEAVCPDADAAIPFPLDSTKWEVVEKSEPEVTSEGIGFSYVTYRKK